MKSHFLTALNCFISPIFIKFSPEFTEKAKKYEIFDSKLPNHNSDKYVNKTITKDSVFQEKFKIVKKNARNFPVEIDMVTSMIWIVTTCDSDRRFKNTKNMEKIASGFDLRKKREIYENTTPTKNR